MEKLDAVGLDFLSETFSIGKRPDGSPVLIDSLPVLSDETMWLIVLLCAKEFELSSVPCKPPNIDLTSEMAQRHEQPHHQFVIATKATRIVVVAARSFFHLVAAICEILLNESLVRTNSQESWLLAQSKNS